MNPKNFLKISATILVAALLAIGFNNCGDIQLRHSMSSHAGSTTMGSAHNSSSQMREDKDSGNSGGTIVGNPKPTNIVVFSPFEVEQNQAKNNLPKNDFFATLCVEKIKFKDSVAGPKDQEISVGEIYLKNEGTFLTGVTFEPGIYEEVELKIKDKCKTKTSITLENQFGKYKSKDERRIKFKRRFVLTGRSLVELDISSLMADFSSINSKKSLETVQFVLRSKSALIQNRCLKRKSAHTTTKKALLVYPEMLVINCIQQDSNCISTICPLPRTSLLYGANSSPWLAN